MTGENIKKFINKTAQEMYREQQDVFQDIHRCFEEKAVIKKELLSQHFMPGRNIVATYAFVPDDLVMVHVEDITERKLAEEKLRESEEKFRSILENMEEAYFEVDLAGKVTFFNDAMCRHFGYSRDELMGMNYRQYTDQDNAEKLFQAYNKVYTSGEPLKELSWQITRKDGTKRYIEGSASLIKNSSGKPTGFKGIDRDITERKRAEEALRQSEELYTRLVNTIPDIIVRTDLEGKILFLNDYTLEISGYSREGIEGRNMLMFISPEDHERAIQDIQLMTERRGRPKEYILITKDGRRIPIDVNGDVLRNEDGTPFGIVNVCRDISERKHTEMVLRENEERLRGITQNTAGNYLSFLCKRQRRIRIELRQWTLNGVFW